MQLITSTSQKQTRESHYVNLLHVDYAEVARKPGGATALMFNNRTSVPYYMSESVTRFDLCDTFLAVEIHGARYYVNRINIASAYFNEDADRLNISFASGNSLVLFNVIGEKILEVLGFELSSNLILRRKLERQIYSVIDEYYPLVRYTTTGFWVFTKHHSETDKSVVRRSCDNWGFRF